MGNNSVPKCIFRLFRFPVYRGSVLGRFYCILQPERPQMTVWRMRIACWITIATNTHTQYMQYPLLFHCNNGCTNAPHSCIKVHRLSFWNPILTYWTGCISKTINRTVIWLKTPFRPMSYTFYTPAFGSEMWQLNVTGRTSNTARASRRHVDGRTDEQTVWRKMILLISPCSCHISWHANCAAAAREKPEFNHNFLKARHTASSTGHWFTLIS